MGTEDFPETTLEFERIFSKTGGVKLLFFPFLIMKTTVLRTFVYTAKVKQKQKKQINKNVEYFKMINGRLFIHKFCNISKMLLSPCWAMPIGALVFVFNKGQFFQNLINGGCGIRISWEENFLKINKRSWQGVRDVY